MLIENSSDRSDEERFVAEIFRLAGEVGDLVYSSFFNGPSIDDPTDPYDLLNKSMALVNQRSTSWQAYARVAGFAIGCRMLQQWCMEQRLESGFDVQGCWPQMEMDVPTIIEPLESCYF